MCRNLLHTYRERQDFQAQKVAAQLLGALSPPGSGENARAYYLA